MLELQNITKIYHPGSATEHRLFEGFSLTVPDGQFVSIVGSNGSGKTSLLNIICGSIGVEGGDVLVDGESIRKKKEFQRYASMGRVYQNPALGTAPNLTMLENLSLADNKGKTFGLSRGVNRKRLDFYRSELSALGLGLEDKLDVKMGALSGGQRQAVALARALVRDPDILILDEPTSNMDNASEQMIKNRLKAVMGNKTLVLITHRLSMLELVDRLIVMEGGRIIADGPKNEVLRRLREQPAPRTEQ